MARKIERFTYIYGDNNLKQQMDNHFFRFVICIIFLPLVLAGCFGTSGISLTKGDYNIAPPPSINGAMRHVGKADSLRTLMAEIGYGPRKIFSGRVHSDSQNAGAYDKTTLPEADGQITYNLSYLEGFFEYREIHGTESDNEWGIGLGLYPFPYFDFFGAINTSISEIGAFVLFSASMESVDYEGIAVDAPSTYKEAWQGDYVDSPRYISNTNEVSIHGNVELGVFLNFFMGAFAISYVPSVFFPWLFWDDLGEYNTTFFYPMLLMQNVQVSYNLPKWTVAVSFRDIVSNSLSGNYWRIGLNVSYCL